MSGCLVARLGLAARLLVFGTLAALLLSVLGGWGLRNALHEALRSSFEQRLDERAELVMARFSLRSDGEPVYVEPRTGDDFERIFSGWYWRVTGLDTRLHSRSLWDAELTGVLAASPHRLSAIGPQQEPLFGVVRRLPAAENTAWQLEVFGSARPVLDELHAFDRSLWQLSVGLLLALCAMTVVQVRFGLRPLARLRVAVDEVERGERDRLGEGYGVDLDPFAEQLDGVLERNARVVIRARSHAADLAHALKKPLALLRSEADLAISVPSTLIREQVEDAVRLIDRHLARAGSGAGELRRIALRPRVEALVALMQQLHVTRKLTWHVDVADSLHWRGEPTDLEEMLGNLLDNAGKWAATQVWVAALVENGTICVCIDDDGPGLSEAQFSRAAERGSRFDEKVEGSGLGLAISADIAVTYDGSLVLARSPRGGLRARLCLPT